MATAVLVRDAERLRKIFSSVRQAFNKAFVKPDERSAREADQLYFALQFDLLRKE